MLDVPRELLIYVARLLRARRRELGTRNGTRLLTCHKQAVFAIVWFRGKPGIPRLGQGFGLSQATSYRYLNEVIEVLAAQAPDLCQALERAGADGLPHLILDGKVVETNRCREKTISAKGRVIDLWYAGKIHDFGGNIQALFAPGGLPLWVSDVLPEMSMTSPPPASSSSISCGPTWQTCPSSPTQATKAQVTASTPPVKQPKTAPGSTSTRAPGTPCSAPCAASANAASPCYPSAGKTLQHVTLSPGRIGHIAKAALVLVHFEHRMIT
jgi:hypothetical protein